MKAVLDMFDNFFERRKGVRRLLVLWAVCIITWVTLRIFTDPSVITGPVATAFATVTTLLTAAIGFYQWSRGKDDARCQPPERN